MRAISGPKSTLYHFPVKVACLLAAAAAASALFVAGAYAQPLTTPGRFVALSAGRRIYLQCEGAGAPTVLLESGFAGSSSGWAKVQPLIAKTTRVCAYDRAGNGLSDAGPKPRDGEAIARDLDRVLRRGGIAGPFVLVGHSAGGLYVRLFAARRPQDVAGMVLVDPMVEHQDQRFAARFGPGAGSLAPLRARAHRCLAAADTAPSDCASHSSEGTRAYRTASPARRRADWQTQISELKALTGATSDEVDAKASSFGDTPLIVLTAGGSYAQAPAPLRDSALAFWAGLHAELAARSTRGRARIVPGSSHLMMLDRPDAIADAVAEVIAQGRKAAQTAPATTRRTAPVSASISSAPATTAGVR